VALVSTITPLLEVISVTISFNRPTNDLGERVPPSDFGEHRRLHRICGPGCLCPLKEQTGTFTEAAIYVPTQGRYAGQYVAACARGTCGYFGEYCHAFNQTIDYDNLLTTLCPVWFERFYGKRGLPIRRYPLRGKSLQSVKQPKYI